MTTPIRIWQFMKYRYWAGGMSMLLVLISLGAFAVKGLNLGLDFTGGVLIEMAYPQSVPLEPVRQALHDNGYHGAVVQYFGSSTQLLVRLPPQPQQEDKQLLADTLVKHLQTQVQQPGVIKRLEVVGPQVGDDLREQSGLAMLIALVCILAYVAFRFEFKFAFGSVLALFHDVIVTVGVFAVTGMTFDLTVLAAVLAIIGYSINDSIVIGDRIRENFIKMRGLTPVEVIDLSLSQTLRRTIFTSVTVFLVLIALLVWGGDMIFGFAVAMSVGVVFGMYSSIYIASALLLVLKISKEDFLPPPTVVDDRP
jgi:preprotein translocase subunit SecF